MRYLLLTRGMPLCGKTTWIQKYRLEPYVLSPSFFQSALHAPMLDDSGEFVVDSQSSKLAYSMLFNALESRMSSGDFIIIEDWHISKSYCSHYKALAKRYAYEILVVDFSKVPFETICERNAAKKPISYSTEELQQLYDSLINSEIPVKCRVILPDDIETLLHAEPHNLNGYKKIHHIGDIHGSYHVLRQYLGTMKNDEFYIFLGDYIDRGFQNYEVLRFLLGIMDRKNVCLIEGNHEKWLWEWANNRDVEAKEFRFNTKVELEKKGFSRQDAHNFYTKLVPYFFYRFHDKRVICTHGGISNMPESPILLSSTQSIHGVGSYLNASSISKSFSKNTPDNFYQVFGHRNKTDLPICLYDKSFILEAKVEFGGYLRTLQLSQQGFSDTSLRNTIFVNQEEKELQRGVQKFFDFVANNKKFVLSNCGNLTDFVSVLYQNGLGELGLPSCTFNPCVIDTKKWQIVARGYHADMDKNSHFKVNNIDILEQVSYPFNITRKLFGRQIIISYYNGKFYLCRDSIVETRLPSFLQDRAKQSKLTHLFKNKSHSMIFLQTFANEFYLLDVFANQTQAKAYLHGEKEKIAKLLNIKMQNPLFTLADTTQFNDFMKAFNKYNIIISKSKSLQSSENLASTMASLNLENANLANINSADKALQLESYKNKDDFITQNKKNSQKKIFLDIHVIESCVEKSSLTTNIAFSLSGFSVIGGNGCFFEIPTLYDYEMKVISELIKIWRFKNCVTPLAWINNPFRMAFMQWFESFILQNKWKNAPTEWIQNAFLQALQKRNAKLIPHTFSIG